MNIVNSLKQLEEKLKFYLDIEKKLYPDSLAGLIGKITD
jgi:hypothetical protein